MEKRFLGWAVMVLLVGCGAEDIAGVDRGESALASKTTICHATGSASQPYEVIAVDDNALPAHYHHQDGQDIIPMPEGGCPTILCCDGECVPDPVVPTYR